MTSTVEKEARNRAMRAQHAARRLREAAALERQACDRALVMAQQHSESAAQHEAKAQGHDRAAAIKDAEQKEWEALLPEVAMGMPVEPQEQAPRQLTRGAIAAAIDGKLRSGDCVVDFEGVVDAVLDLILPHVNT